MSSNEQQRVEILQGTLDLIILRILAGMGQQEPVSVEITWPSGKIQKLQKPGYNRYLKITEPE